MPRLLRRGRYKFFTVTPTKERNKNLKRKELLLAQHISIMSYELTGKLVAKYDTVQRTETFKIREFAVEKSEDINGRTITNYVKFQSVQDKTTIIDKVNVGDNIKVYFNIKGTKWEKEGKTSYFTNLDAWRIEQILQPGSGAQTDSEFIEPLDTFSATPPDAVDDLPF